MKTLAAAFTACLLAGVAAPALAGDALIAFRDLDLAAPSGAANLDARIDAAARDLCRGARKPGSRISDRAFCREAVRAEAMRQLPAQARYDYALGRLPVVL